MLDGYIVGLNVHVGIGVARRLGVEDQGVADDVGTDAGQPLVHLDVATVACRPSVLAYRLRGYDRAGVVRRVDTLAAGVLLLPLASESDGKNLAVGALAHQVDRRVLHGALATDISVDPFHRGVLVGDRPLGYQVVDIPGPVLDRRVTHPGALQGDNLYHRRVERIGRVDRSGASLDVVNEAPFVGDNQGPLELAEVLRVYAEVGLERNIDVDPRRNVDEAPTGPGRAVEGGELVVVVGNNRPEILPHQLRMLPYRRLRITENDTLLRELFLDVVVDHLGVVLSADPRQELALRLGDSDAVEGVLDVLRNVVPALPLLLRGGGVVDQVVEVEIREVGPPVDHRLRLKGVKRLKAKLRHPLGFFLVGRDRPDHFLVETFAGLEDRLVGIMKAKFIFANVNRCLRVAHSVPPPCRFRTAP